MENNYYDTTWNEQHFMTIKKLKYEYLELNKMAQLYKKY